MDEQTLRQHIKIYLDGLPPLVRANAVRRLIGDMYQGIAIPVVLHSDLVYDYMEDGSTEEQANRMVDQVSKEVAAMVDSRMEHLVYLASVRLKRPMPRPPWWLGTEDDGGEE